MKTAISHRFTKRIIALVMMFVLAGGVLLAFSSPAKADEDEMANYSFYKLSSSLAAFFSNAQSPDDKAPDIDGEVWASVLEDPGSAGSMLGYVDKDLTPSFDFLNSALSGSSSSIGYDTLTQTADGAEVKSTDTPGMLDYAHFGATLNALGLDSMGTGLQLGFGAKVAGGLMLILYVLSGVVDLLFVGIIGVLKTLNPFTLFYVGVKAISPELADGMTGGAAPPTFLGGLASWIGDWYQVLNDIAWSVLVPLFLGVVVLGLLLAKNANRGSALKKLVIRMVFIGVGIPLIGSMYTGVLNSMGDASKSGSSGSTQVVLSTYVDFQNWAFKNRLHVPEGAVIEWDASRSKPTADSLANVRSTALEINKSTNTSWNSIDSTLKIPYGSSWTDAALKDGVDDSGGVQGYMGTMDMLGRYITGAKVDAASFESAVKGSISTSRPYTTDEEGKAKVADWFIKFGDPKKTLPDIDSYDVVAGNPVIRVEDDYGLKAEPAGATGGTKTFTTSSQVMSCNSRVSDASGEPRKCNMSTLSLYNFLNTSFGSDSMTIYSSEKSTSGATREIHNAVTQVGTGTMGALYWLNSMVLLASFVIIGLGYALSMLFSNIKRSFQLVTAIPFATIGALPGIAKVIIYTAAMILEVILTLFLYRFVQTFLISIPQIVEMPFSLVLNGDQGAGAAATNLLTGGTLPMAMTVLSIIALIIFTVLAIRIRKTVVKAVQEAVTKLVDKFLDTNIAPPGGKGNLAPALAGGLASGAGMAAANKAMGGGMGGGGGKKPGVSGNGHSPVTAGGIPSTEGNDGGPAGGGPAGALTVGGGAGMEISGSEGDAGPDGSGGRPNGEGPGGKGGPGSPLGLTTGPGTGDDATMNRAGSSDQAVAKSLEAQGGLSEPGVTGGSSLSEKGSRGSGDVMDTLAGSAEATQAQYRAQDQAKIDGVVAGGKALGKGAEAAGRGMAGDVSGAAAAGGAAVGHAQEAQAKNEQAKSIKEDINSQPVAPERNTGGTAGGASGAAAAAAAGGTAAGYAQGAQTKGAQTAASATGASGSGTAKKLGTGPATTGAVSSGSAGATAAGATQRTTAAGSTAAPAPTGAKGKGSTGKGQGSAGAAKGPRTPAAGSTAAPAPTGAKGQGSAGAVKAPRTTAAGSTAAPALKATPRPAQTPVSRPAQTPRPSGSRPAQAPAQASRPAQASGSRPAQAARPSGSRPAQAPAQASRPAQAPASRPAQTPRPSVSRPAQAPVSRPAQTLRPSVSRPAQAPASRPAQTPRPSGSRPAQTPVSRPAQTPRVVPPRSPGKKGPDADMN